MSNVNMNSTPDDYNLYQGMKDWSAQHTENAMNASASLQQDGADSDSIWSDYLEQKEEIGQTYDFMEGKDVNDETQYNEQLLKLGQGEVADKDYDGNGTVSYDEYVLAELDDPAAEGIEEETTETAYLLAGIIDTCMGDGDGEISDEEFAEFYKNAEGYVGDGTQEFDGKIDIDTMTEYVEFLTSQVSLSDETAESIENLVSSNSTREELVTALQNKISEEADTESESCAADADDECVEESTEETAIKETARVESWEAGSKGDNCLYNIVENHYGVELSSMSQEEANKYYDAIVEANPEIFNSGRNTLNNSGSIYNTVLFAGDEIIIPEIAA